MSYNSQKLIRGDGSWSLIVVIGGCGYPDNSPSVDLQLIFYMFLTWLFVSSQF